MPNDDAKHEIGHERRPRRTRQPAAREDRPNRDQVRNVDPPHAIDDRAPRHRGALLQEDAGRDEERRHVEERPGRAQPEVGGVERLAERGGARVRHDDGEDRARLQAVDLDETARDLDVLRKACLAV